MVQALAVIQVLLSMALCGLILMHSGRDTGLGGMGFTPASGPPGVLRVALSDFRWPLDPALATGRDETTLARALYATQFRLDPVTGRLQPGLCSGFAANRTRTQWGFVCRPAPAIAAALRRVGRLRESPLHWAFAGASIRVPGPHALR